MDSARRFVFAVPLDLQPSRKVLIRHGGRQFHITVPRSHQPGDRLVVEEPPLQATGNDEFTLLSGGGGGGGIHELE